MRTKTRGQALTEFALILPLLLLLLLGVIEGARIAWAYITIQESAREAARYAVSGQPYNQGEPWAFRARLTDGYAASCVNVDNLGSWNAACDATNPADPDAIDRVDAINRAVIQRAYGLNIQRYALSSGAYTSTGFYDAPGTLGVLVIGQDYDDSNQIQFYPDNAGKEGLNVMVSVYYNLEMLDPIYDAMVRAITGGPFIRLQGQVQMQNEGVDMALGSTPPAGIPTPVPPAGGTPSGSAIIPLILSPNGTTFEVNSAIRVRLEQHTPNNYYDIYLGTTPICSNVQVNGLGITEVDCLIPPDFAPGTYELTSTLPGGGSRVAGPLSINVTRLARPTLLVEDGYSWPAGSPIVLQLRSHDPHTQYEMYFNGTPIGTTDATDAFGDVDFPWAIPSDTPPRESPSSYRFESHAIGNASEVAHADIYVTTPQIVVQGGNTWPAGTNLRANLRRHAPNRSYEVRCNGISVGSFTTNSSGQSISTIMCTIPVVAPNSPPYYTITSYDGGILIGQVNITVSTPDEPYLVIVGGYDWPAGSPIDVQLFKHGANHDYELYFGPWPMLADTIRTDGSGFAEMAYLIPVTATAATTYSLRSVDPQSHDTIASRTVTVRSAPQINVTEGTIVQPGSTIHVNLTGHAQNAVYTILLNGAELGSVQTDNNGQGSLTYDLRSFSSTGGPFVLESRFGTTRVAQTNLTIIAADLAVTNIEVPPALVFNTSVPITITIRNNSSVAISGQWFDTDIYVDPERAPDVAHPFPPGDFKLWLDYLAPNSIATFVQNVVFYGAGDHRVYARTNTSAYVLESDAANPINNMMSTVAVATGCGASVDEALTTDAIQDDAFGSGWEGVAFGDGGPGSQSISNDLIHLSSGGSSTTRNDDKNGGYYFYYQTVPGDFDVYVRARSQTGSSSWARFGLEVRDSTATNARKVELLQTRSNAIQYAYRATAGGNVTRDTVVGSNSTLPAWLRIARIGNDFTLYYAYTANTPPQASDWVAWDTYTIVMSDPVLVGLANASYDTTNEVTFDNLHVCIDPGSVTSCGAVREEAGLVALDATNFVQNIPRVVNSTAAITWQQATMSSRRVMQALPNIGQLVNAGYSTGSPELQYQVNIETPGDYFVWVYGAGPDGDADSVHIGLDGVENAESDRIQLNSAGSLSWTNSTMDSAPAIIRNVTAGMHTLNLWMREDGAWVYKILLTTNASYTPTGDVSQSECDVSTGQDPYPPGMTVCTPSNAPLLSNGDFEDTPGWQTAWQPWPPVSGANILGKNPHNSNMSMVLDSWQEGSGFLWPYMWQRFTMPDWITSSTTMNLRLWKSVDQQVTSEVSDTLKVILRTDESTPAAVSTATIIARGDQGAGYPNNYVSGEWDLALAMRAAGHDPANYTGQNLRLYIYDDSNASSCLSAPGPNCYKTSFYVDDVKLEICTSQPVPSPDPSLATIKGAVRVWIGGIPARKQGVRVWAYRQNGAMYTTYSIQDATYGFYLMEPGDYVLYAEWWEGPDLYTAMTSLRVSAGIQYTRDLNLY
jgi:hypothetical protein